MAGSIKLQLAMELTLPQATQCGASPTRNPIGLILLRTRQLARLI